MKSCMSREALGRMLHDLIGEVTKEYVRWEMLSPQRQEDACCVAEAFCFNAQWPTPAPRAFHARVALMGHRNLGLCRVTEAPLAGVMLLRCESPAGVEWVNPTAVYSIGEVPEAEALSEIAIEATRAKREADREAEAKAARRAERGAYTVDIVLDEATCEVAMLCTAAPRLPGHFRDVNDALKAHGFSSTASGTISRALRDVGLIVPFAGTPQEATAAMQAVARDLGFRVGETRAAVGDELTSEIPF